MATDHLFCANQLKKAAGDIGTDIVISTEPPIVQGEYETGEFTCPHGVTFYIEPSGEQIAEWVRTGTP